MASVFLIPQTNHKDEPAYTKWVTFVAVGVTLLIVAFVFGLEYWLAHEHGDKRGVLATLAAPVYGLLKGMSMVLTNSASIVANGATAVVGAAGRVGKVIE